jgi:hypothetical protein
MAGETPIKELGLSEQEWKIFTRVFGSGRKHPWSDALLDSMMDWTDSIVIEYLKAKRNPEVLKDLMPQLAPLLDRIILDRVEGLRAAAENIHENPPYFTADRWPREELSVISRVVAWAFGEC